MSNGIVIYIYFNLYFTFNYIMFGLSFKYLNPTFFFYLIGDLCFFPFIYGWWLLMVIVFLIHLMMFVIVIVFMSNQFSLTNLLYFSLSDGFSILQFWHLNLFFHVTYVLDVYYLFKPSLAPIFNISHHVFIIFSY